MKLKSLLPFIICTSAALFYVYDYFIQVAPSIMTDNLMQTFDIGAAELGVLSAAFYYSYTFMQIPAGFLLDTFGARKTLSLAVLVSGLGVILFSQTSVFVTASFSRFLVGAGSAFAFVSALYLVSRWFPHRYFAFIAGLIQMAGCIGSIIGEAPLAMIVNQHGWRETLFYTGIITLLLAVLFYLVIRDGNDSLSKHSISRPKQQRTIFATTPPSLWRKPESRRVMDPAVKPRDDEVSRGMTRREQLSIFYLLKQKQIWWIASISLIAWVPVTSIGALWGIPYLMKVFSLSNVGAGKIVTLFWVGLGIGSPLMGWFSDKIQRRRLPLIICFSAGLIGMLLLFFAAYLTPFVVAVALTLLGFSASVQSLSFGILKDSVPANMFATASGFNNMSAILGGAIAQTSVGFLLAWLWGGIKMNNVPIYSPENYRIALLIVPIALLIGLLISILKIRETYCKVFS